MNNENKWMRISEKDRRWHLNVKMPATPQKGVALCGVESATPIYSSTLYGIGSNIAVINQCLNCIEHQRIHGKVEDKS